MKKIIIALVIALSGLVSGLASAQNVVDKGSNLINLGVGLNSVQSHNYLTLSGSWDYGVAGALWDNQSALSLGVLGSFSTGNGVRSIIVGPTIGLHYHFIPALDTYARLMLGYSAWMYDDPDFNEGGFGWGFNVGVRYLFTSNVGAFIEVGYGTSVANIGVSFKF